MMNDKTAQNNYFHGFPCVMIFMNNTVCNMSTVQDENPHIDNENG